MVFTQFGFISVLLVIVSLWSSQSQAGTYNLRLVGRNHHGPNMENRALGEANMIRVMIACGVETKIDCMERILASVPDGAVDFIHYLETANAYAVYLDEQYLDHVQGVQSDPTRRHQHRPDSKEKPRIRTSSQEIPAGVHMVKAPQVWEKYEVKGEDVLVCVIDTGVNRDHPDLDLERLSGFDGAGGLVTPWWRDSDGHGTHVVGTIAAKDNTKGLVGVAPKVDVYAVRIVASEDDEIYSSDMVAALEICRASGAQVVSMSLGGLESSVMEEATLKAFFENDDIVAVAAAGDTGGDDLVYPAAYNFVLSVAAVDQGGNRASFSTWNDMVDISAPGVSVLSTWADGTYLSMSGTDMACPHVTGVVALMLSVDPYLSPSQVFETLKATAVNPNDWEWDMYYGSGIVNALAAVDSVYEGEDHTDGHYDSDGNNNEFGGIDYNYDSGDHESDDKEEAEEVGESYPPVGNYDFVTVNKRGPENPIPTDNDPSSVPNSEDDNGLG